MPDQTLQSQNIDLQPTERDSNYYNPQISPSPKLPGLLQDQPTVADHNPALDISFTPDKTQELFRPEYFNYDETNAARYVDTKNYNNLGFDPQAGPINEEKYAQAQSWTDQFRNAFAGLGVGAWDEAEKQIKSYSNTVKAFTDPTLKSIFTTEQANEINSKDREFQNNYPIFASAVDKPVWTSIMQHIQGAGPIIGSVAELAAEQFLTDAAIAATFGGASGLEVIEAKRIGDATKRAEKLMNSVNSPNMVRKVFVGMGETVSKLPGIGNTLRYGADLAAYGAEGGAMATIGRGLGAFTHDLRGINLAVSFASSNAANTYNDLLTSQKEKYRKEYGKNPDDIDLEGMKDVASKASKTDGAINAWAMLFTEKLAFGNILTGRKALTETLLNEGKDIYSKVGIKPSWLMKEGESPVFLKDNNWLSFKANYYALPRSMAEHGVGFGIQTGTMAVIDRAVKSYYEAKYNNKDVNWADELRDSLGKQFSKDGAENFISSFLTGALVMGVGGHLVGHAKDAIVDRYNKNKDAQYIKNEDGTYISKEEYTTQRAKEFIDKANDAWNNPQNPIKQNIHDVVLQSVQQKIAKDATQKDDRKTLEDAKDDSTRLFVMSAMKNNILDLYLDRLKNYTQQLSPQEQCEAFGIPYSEENYSELQNQLNLFQGRAKDLKRIARMVNGKMGNPFNPTKYKPGTDEYNRESFRQRTYDIAKDYVIYTHDNVERSLERQNELLNGKGDTTGISDMPFAKHIDFSTLFSITNPEMLDKEMKSTIELMTNLDQSSKEYRELKQRQELLENYHNDLKRYTEEYHSILEKGDKLSNEQIEKAKNDLDEKSHDRLTNSLHALLNHNSISNGQGAMMKNDVRDGVDKLLDYYKLGVEYNQSLKMANTIVDPSIINRYLDSFIKAHAENIKAKEQARKDAEDLKKQQFKEDLTARTQEKPLPQLPTEKKSPFEKAEEIPFEEEPQEPSAEPLATKPKGVDVLNMSDLKRFGTYTLPITRDGEPVGEHALTVRITDGDNSFATAEPVNGKVDISDFDAVRDAFKKVGNQLAESGIKLQENADANKDEQNVWRALKKEGYAKTDTDGLHYFVGDAEREKSETLKTTTTPEEKYVEEQWDADYGVEADTNTEQVDYGKKGYTPGNLLTSVMGPHYDIIEGKEVESKNSEIQRFYRTSANIVLPTAGTYFLEINHGESGNNPYGITKHDKGYPNDVKLVLVNEDKKPFNGKDIIENPNKDNLVYSSLRQNHKGINLLKGDLNNANDPEIERIVNAVALKDNLTESEKEEFKLDLIDLRRLHADIREGKVKYLELVGKTQGTPVFSNKVIKQGKDGKTYEAQAKFPVEERLVRKGFDPINPIHPNGDRMTFGVTEKGRIFARRGDDEQFNKVYNRRLFSHEKENIINALKYRSTMTSKHPDYAKVEQLLKSVIFYGAPKANEYVGANRIFVKYDAENAGLYRTKFVYENAKQVMENNGFPKILEERICSFTPSEIEANKDKILDNIYHNVNNNRLQSNEPYISRKVTEKEGAFAIEDQKTYRNYLEYLIKPKGSSEVEENDLPISAPPIHTNIITYDPTGEAQFKNINFIYQREGGNLDRKKEVKQPQKASKQDTYGSFIYPTDYKQDKIAQNNLQQEINDETDPKDPNTIYKYLSDVLKADFNKPLNAEGDLFKIEDTQNGMHIISILKDDLDKEKIIVLDSRSKPIEQKHVASKIEPIPQPAPEDIEAKRADIERRRKEEMSTLLAKYEKKENREPGTNVFAEGVKVKQKYDAELAALEQQKPETITNSEIINNLDATITEPEDSVPAEAVTAPFDLGKNLSSLDNDLKGKTAINDYDESAFTEPDC